MVDEVAIYAPEAYDASYPTELVEDMAAVSIQVSTKGV